MKRVTWIGGWGLSPEILRPLAISLWPDADHEFVAPDESAANSAAQSEMVVSWSLGACRVLDAAARGVVFEGKVVLLAPFLAFPAEHELGGKCPLIQVRWLRRWVQREPFRALADFYHRAGLGQLPPEKLPYSAQELLNGLDRLMAGPEAGARERFNSGLPPGWRAIVGDQDSLLEAQGVAKSLPGCLIAAGAGHSARELIEKSREVLHAL